MNRSLVIPLISIIWLFWRLDNGMHSNQYFIIQNFYCDVYMYFLMAERPKMTFLTNTVCKAIKWSFSGFWGLSLEAQLIDLSIVKILCKSTLPGKILWKKVEGWKSLKFQNPKFSCKFLCRFWTLEGNYLKPRTVDLAHFLYSE